MTDVNEKTDPTLEEVETIIGDPYRLHLEGADIDVYLEQLRTRQLLRFLKILSAGAGAALADLRLDAGMDTAELTQQIVAILLVSIPEAEDETIEFIHSMLRPLGVIEPERSKEDRKTNVDLYTEMYTTLANPKLEDTIAILVRIVQNEAPNLVALGKTVAALIPSVAAPTTSSKKRSTKPARTA